VSLKLKLDETAYELIPFKLII